MPVSRSAVQRWLNRPLRNYDWIKDYSEKKLDVEIAAMLPQTLFHTPNWLHQKACFLLGTHRSAFLFLLDMGGGKSKIVLDIIKYRQLADNAGPALVLVPNRVNLDSWEDQIKFHQPTLRYEGVTSAWWHANEQTKNPGIDIFVMTYASLVAYLADVEIEDPKKKKRTGKVFEPNRDKIVDFAKRFSFVVYDEIHTIANHTATAWKIAELMRPIVPFRYGLTGTPFGRDLHRLWACFRIVDGGQTLGETLTIFRGAFFTSKPGYWGGYEHTFIKEREPDLMDMIKHRSIRYTEFPGQPRVVSTMVRLTMTPEMQRYYIKLKNKMKEVRGNLRLMESVFMQARQLASGFIGAHDDEGKVDIILPGENPKIEALRQLLEGMPRHRKMVISHEFQMTGELIHRLLLDMKIKHARINGLVKNPGAERRKFIDDPECYVIAINSAAGGTGLDGIQDVANFQVFFECPPDPIRRQQMEKRVDRSGQKQDTVYRWDLVMRDTVDARLLGFCRQGRKLKEAILDGEGL